MKVKIKKSHVDAIIPQYAKPGDAGMDLTAVSVEMDEHDNIVYNTGLQMEIPEGHVGLLFPRSSLSKYDLIQTNHVGVIDSGYRGDIMIKFKPSFDYWDDDKDSNTFGNPLDNSGGLEIGKFHFFDSPEDKNRDISTIIDVYAVGDRVGQLLIIPYPKIEFEEVDDLTTSERGDGGFGSSGK